MRKIRIGIVLFVALLYATSPSPASGQPCIGDCDGDGLVVIGELIVAVSIVLGFAAVEECTAIDPDGDGNVDISNVISAVNAALTGCPGPPSVSGSISVPPEDQCTECSETEAEIVVFGLVRNGPPPAALLTSVTADAEGMFDTGDLSEELADYPFSPDTNADGLRTFIVLATVNPDSGAAIGGVISLDANAPLAKDFTGTTQVACLAAVFLTEGTDVFGDPGCMVRADCMEQGDCVTSLDPDALGNMRIDNLEEASSFIVSDVIFPGDVLRAACAIIDCTGGGANPTTPECVAGEF